MEHTRMLDQTLKRCAGQCHIRTIYVSSLAFRQL